MENKNDIGQCIDFFKTNSGFKRLFCGILDKYRSIGAIGGTIKINKLSHAEKEALSGLLRKDYYSKINASIKVEKIISALEGTKFQGVNFEEVLKGYFGGELISKKEEVNTYKKERNVFFCDIIAEFNNTRASEWLEYVFSSKENAYLVLNKKYDANRIELYKNLTNVCKAINSVSLDKSNTMRLALFSSQITKNPHYFDYGTEGGKLLLYGIAYIFKQDVPGLVENRAELLYRAGIISDEISNFTICSGLKAYNKEKEHEGWHGFYEAEEPMFASLYNLSCVDRIVPNKRRVYVFENPTVFTEVLKQTSSLKASLVCTYGQLKLSALVLLDRIAFESDNIFYSGDFDPEGLAIADNLKERYGDKLILWRFEEVDYIKAKSKDRIVETRRKKLSTLKSGKLKEISQIIAREQYAGYQELLIDDYVSDVKKFYS